MTLLVANGFMDVVNNKARPSICFLKKVEQYITCAVSRKGKVSTSLGSVFTTPQVKKGVQHLGDKSVNDGFSYIKNQITGPATQTAIMEELKNCKFQMWQKNGSKDTRNCALLACQIVADAYLHHEWTTRPIRSRRMGIYEKSRIFTRTMDYLIEYDCMEKKGKTRPHPGFLKEIKHALMLALPPVDVQNSTLVSVMDPMSRMATVDDGSLDSEPTEYPMLSLVDSVEPCPGNANIELNSSNNMLVARQTLTNIELKEDEHYKKNSRGGHGPGSCKNGY
jgi:hypothetical protein